MRVRRESTGNRKYYRKETIYERRHEIRRKITEIIKTAEKNLRKSHSNRNIYDRFMIIWNTMSSSKKMGYLNEEDLSKILNNDNYGKEIIKLYNRYWKYSVRVQEEENTDHLLNVIISKINKLEKKLEEKFDNN